MKICLIGTVASSTLNFRKTFIELLTQEGHEVYVFATDYSEKTSAAIKALGAEPVSYQLNRGGLMHLILFFHIFPNLSYLAHLPPSLPKYHAL